ncbi:hypothetical protein MRB53_042048 [Persea americana]|nr:hypothetical protein MRB53_042048 [Persea americana]
MRNFGQHITAPSFAAVHFNAVTAAAIAAWNAGGKHSNRKVMVVRYDFFFDFWRWLAACPRFVEAINVDRQLMS